MALAVAQHHCVDGAQCLGILRKGVEQRNDGLFAGMCDIEADKVMGLRLFDQFGKVLRPSAQKVEVEQVITVGKTLAARFPDVQGGRQRRLDAGTDKTGAHDRGRAVHPYYPRDATAAFAPSQLAALPAPGQNRPLTPIKS
jgi:hypothetical protein